MKKIFTAGEKSAKLKSVVSLRFWLIFFLFISVGCSSLEEDSPDTRIFKAPRSVVWEALIQAFSSYKLKSSDEERGLIETELITGTDVWTPAHDEERDTLGFQNRITAQLFYSKPHATVIIKKKLKRKRGFLSRSEKLPSDFLEEEVLLYRLEREIHIRRMIQKYK